MTVNPPIDMRVTRDTMANHPWQSSLPCFQLPGNQVSDPKDYLHYRKMETVSPPCDKKPKIAFSIDSIVGKDELNCDQQPLTPTTPTLRIPCASNRTPSPASSSVVTPETPVSPRPFSQHHPSQPHFQWPPTQQQQGHPQSHPQMLEALNHLRSLYGNENAIPPHVAAAVNFRHQLNPHFQPAVGMPVLPPFPGVPQMMQPSNPLYPWLLARQGRFFGHRFPQGPEMAGFLLAPFRKPKRVRTAFSPSQLLKLESAFDKNHYVVGAERKQLAQTLNLSETQVKVWFQNRRTKHKRVVHDGPDDLPGRSDNQNKSSGDMRSDESDIEESDVDLDIEDETHC